MNIDNQDIANYTLTIIVIVYCIAVYRLHKNHTKFIVKQIEDKYTSEHEESYWDSLRELRRKQWKK